MSQETPCYYRLSQGFHESLVEGLRLCCGVLLALDSHQSAQLNGIDCLAGLARDKLAALWDELDELEKAEGKPDRANELLSKVRILENTIAEKDAAMGKAARMLDAQRERLSMYERKYGEIEAERGGHVQ
jgi:hypothetical protein